MKLQRADQISASDLRNIDFNVVLAASGYESRATYVARNLDLHGAQKKVAFAFSDRIVLARRQNDRDFRRLGFELIKSAGSSSKPITAEIIAAFRSVRRDDVTVLVDYSSMTKIWYAAILRLFAAIDAAVRQLNVYFAYSPSKFSRPTQPAPNQYMGPVPGFYNLDLPDRKTALVIGLGYEAERALGLVDYVEPAETFAFYTDPAPDRNFPKTVRRNNAQLLRRLGSSRTFKYPAEDLQTTATILLSLALGLAKDFRVILAPLGPKPFALLCFLLASRYEEFDVWRVSSGEQGRALDRPPGGKLIVARVCYTAE